MSYCTEEEASALQEYAWLHSYCPVSLERGHTSETELSPDRTRAMLIRLGLVLFLGLVSLTATILLQHERHSCTLPPLPHSEPAPSLSLEPLTRNHSDPPQTLTLEHRKKQLDAMQDWLETSVKLLSNLNQRTEALESQQAVLARSVER